MEAPILEKLKKDYEMFQRNNEPYAEKYTNSDIDTFDKWYKKREKKFRVLFTSETGKLSDETIDLINNEYNLEKPHSFFTGIEPGEYEIYEYIFTFTCFEANDDIRIKRKNGQWFIGDIITKNGEMIQLKRLNKKTNKPPFLLDSKFKESFKNIFNESDDIDNIINDKSEFKEGFLEKLFTEYTSNENMI